MSWDSYLDNLVAQSKDASGKAHCDRCCIIGLDGGAPWTTAGNANSLKLQGSEGVDIAKALKSNDVTPFQTSGIRLEGVKYQFLRQDGNVVLGKKKENGSITIQRSKTAVVIGHTFEGGQQGASNKAVGVIAEYLEGMNM